jgi:hypothetical protein
MIAIRFFFKKLTRGGVDLERLAEQVGVSGSRLRVKRLRVGHDY